MNNVITNKKVFLETYGCSMNEYDSELVKSILSKENFTFVKSELDADIVMLNTCAIREHAHRKVFGRVHNIRHARGKDKPVMVGLLGCMVTNLRTELLEDRSLKIDFMAGPDSYKRLPALIREAAGEGEKPFDVTLSEFETYSDITPTRKDGVNAWLAVMRGCNNFCTFCVVPYTRGRERSRSPENIVEEVKRLADEGFKQVTLLGQNVNSYKYEEFDFAYLMEEVSKVQGIERIRFSSPHPKDYPDRFLDVMASNPKICKQIHIPLQAGNNRILEMMDRTYTKEEFLALVDRMKSRIPDVALTTDVIVGFPTETDQEFEDTMDVMRQVQFDQAFMFKYSERKGTIASRKFPDDVSEEVKSQRVTRLVTMQKDVVYSQNKKQIGKICEVLVEPATGDRNPSNTVARTDGGHLVIISDVSYPIGSLVKVKIIDATPHVLKAQPAV